MRAEFSSIQGTVIDPRKHYQSNGGGIPATVHQEFWIRSSGQQEFPVHILGQEIPVRSGHIVRLIYHNEILVAALNLSTESYINLVSGWDETRLSWTDIFFLIFSLLLVLLPLIDRWYFLSAIGLALSSWFARNLLLSSAARRRSTKFHHQVETEIRSSISNLRA